MVGYGGSSAGSYLADPTSPIPSHCAPTVATSTVRVKRITCIFILNSCFIAALSTWPSWATMMKADKLETGLCVDRVLFLVSWWPSAALLLFRLWPPIVPVNCDDCITLHYQLLWILLWDVGFLYSLITFSTFHTTLQPHNESYASCFSRFWCNYHHCKKQQPQNTIHQVTIMLAISKNILFPGHNHLLTTGTDDPLLWLSPERHLIVEPKIF